MTKDLKDLLSYLAQFSFGATITAFALVIHYEDGLNTRIEKAVEKGEYISTEHRTYTCQRLPDANTLFNNRGLEQGWPPVKAP